MWLSSPAGQSTSHSGGVPLTGSPLVTAGKNLLAAAVGHYGEMINTGKLAMTLTPPLARLACSCPPHPEPLLQPDPVFYTKLLRSAAKIITRADPNDEVWIGSLVSPSAWDCAVNPLTFLLEIHGARGWNSADAISYQPDWGSHAPNSTTSAISPCTSTVTTNVPHGGDIRSVQELARQLGGMPVYITSLGWNATDDLAFLAANRSIQYFPGGSRYAGARQHQPDGARLRPAHFLEYRYYPADLHRQCLAQPGSYWRPPSPSGRSREQPDLYRNFVFEKAPTSRYSSGAPWMATPGIPVSITNLPSNSYIAYGVDMLVLNNTTGTCNPGCCGRVRASSVLNERPVFLLGKVGDLGDQAQSAITDQLEIWQIQIGELINHWLNEAKASFMDMLEELFNQAKDKAVEWGEEQIDELLN